VSGLVGASPRGTLAYLLGNGYRVFNPVIRRFHHPDSLSPFGKGGINSYVYCFSDPINRKDPSGHVPNPITRLIGRMQSPRVAAPILGSAPVVYRNPLASGLETLVDASRSVGAAGAGNRAAFRYHTNPVRSATPTAITEVDSRMMGQRERLQLEILDGRRVGRNMSHQMGQMEKFDRLLGDPSVGSIRGENAPRYIAYHEGDDTVPSTGWAEAPPRYDIPSPRHATGKIRSA
jgi:RHS repeat-associated protein